MGRRTLTALGTAALALAAAIAPGIATGAATTTQSSTPDCDLARSKEAEFGSCVLVTTTIQKAPKVGELGTVTLKLKAATGVSGDAKVRIESTPNIALKTLPTGFKAASAMTKSLGTVGQRATSTIKLSSGATSTRTITFSPTKAGYGSVRVIADSPVEVPGSGGGSADAVFLTFDSKSGTLGLPSKLDGSARTLPVGTKVTVPQYAKINKDAPGLTDEEIQIKDGTWQGDGQQEPPKQLKARASRRAKAAATACVTGRLAVPDITVDSGEAVAVSAANIPVIAWDTRSIPYPGDEPMATGRTAADGSFRLCFLNHERDFFTGGGKADVYVTWKLETANFSVGPRQMFGDVEMDVGNPWQWRTPTVENAPDGDRDLGILTASDPLQAGAIAVFQTANLAWERVPGPCWVQVGSCDRKKIAWSPDSRTWPHFSAIPYGVVQLPWEAALAVRTTAHELGHAIVADVFDYSTDDLIHLNERGCFGSHDGIAPVAAECGFSEGFPNWFAAHVMGSPTGGGFKYGSFIRRPNDMLERATWTFYPELAKGDSGEMRVASALWDIEDGLGTPSTDPYDRIAGGFDRIWAAFQAGKSFTFREFIDRLRDTPGRFLGNDLTSTLYGSTIDWANPYREDLFVNSFRSFGEGNSEGWGWGGPHVAATDPAIGVTSGHRYRMVRPLGLPARNRDYVLAVRSKGPYWNGPIAVNSNTSETLPAPIAGQGPLSRYSWTWSTFSPGATSFRSALWTTAAAVIRNDRFTSEYVYGILPYSGSNLSTSMAFRPGYDIEMTDVVPLTAASASSALLAAQVTFPKGAVARAVSFPLTAGRAAQVKLNRCSGSSMSLEAFQNISMTMMNSSTSAVRTSNRMSGWVAPPARADWGPGAPTLSSGAATSQLTVNPGPTRGFNDKLMWFRPAVSTTAVLLLGIPADTGSATADRCVQVSAYPG